MTEQVASLGDDATIGDVIAMVTDLQIRHVPLVREDGSLAGVLSDRDLRVVGGLVALTIGQEETRENVLDSPAMSLLSGAPITCRSDTPIDTVIDMLIGERIGAIIVVDEAVRPVGIISTIDVLAAARGKLG